MKIRELFALFSSLNKIIYVFKLLFILGKIKIKYLINEKNCENIFRIFFIFENKISKSEKKLKCKNNENTKKWARGC